MVFVYKGAGKKAPNNSEPSCRDSPKCRTLACDIQYCLSKNNYNEKRCKNIINEWKECCNEWEKNHKHLIKKKKKINTNYNIFIFCFVST